MASTHNKNTTKCDIHPNKFYHMFCSDCNDLVCVTCTHRLHQNHTLTEISESVIMKKRQELEQTLSEVKEKHLLELQEDLKLLQRHQKLYNSHIEDCIMQVKKQGELLKQEVDKITNSSIQELVQQEKSDNKFLKNMENKMLRKLSDLNELLTASEERLSHDSGTNFVKFITESVQLIEKLTKKEERINLLPPTFHPRELSTKVIRNLFGDVKKEFRVNMDDLLWTGNNDSDKKDVEPKFNVRVISSFENKQSVNCLSIINESEAWIGGYNYLAMVTREGRKYKSVKLDFSVNDIAKRKSGEIVIATDMEIKKLTTNGEIEDVVDVSPYTAQGVCVTKDGEIFSCLKSEIEGKVVKVAIEGQITQTIQYDKDGALLFRKPGFVTCLDNGTLWVTDEFDNSVVVVNKSGEPQFKYTGPTGVKLKSPFSPKGLTSMKGDKVLVSDCRNHAVHLLDKSGQFLQFLMTSDHGLRGPRSICVDPFGFIWVTCWYNNAVIVSKYESS